MKSKTVLSVILVSGISILLSSSISYAQDSASPPVTSTQILQTSTTWNNHPIAYPTGPAEVTALHIEFAPGSETTWHSHPVPSLAYIISGDLEVTLKDGQTKIFTTGDAFAEVIDTWHYGKNIGDEPVRLVVFYVGEDGTELTKFPPDDQEELD